MDERMDEELCHVVPAWLVLFRPPWRSWKLRRRIWKSERETEWTKFGSKWLRWNGRQWVASFLCASAPFCWYYLVPGPTIISLNSSFKYSRQVIRNDDRCFCETTRETTYNTASYKLYDADHNQEQWARIQRSTIGTQQRTAAIWQKTTYEPVVS